ncbi:unnamed protein product [Adineta steineri]|uniref:Uncharacterized protein n=1 Tax=Adineta steineri TaxID=433720 RepID=A0A815SWJ3_9BILA|nr:unnamed protein product [Adineta steineri]CAF1643336.1 unnamed protein product [Adineta steineri]
MHIKLIIFLVLFGVVASSSSLDWLKFKRNHNKHYKSAAEEAKRKQIFLENVNRIHDYERTHPNATFKLGINHLADRRIEELVSSSKRHFELHSENIGNSLESMNLPDSLDWRTKGVISLVRNEGVIGDVDAIVAVEVIETLYAIQTGNLVAGSVARVIDCCPKESDVFECIAKLRGICRADDYPSTTGQCQPDKCKPFTNFNKVMRLKDQNENTMETWIQNSSLFIGIDASQMSFEFYISGIYTDKSCSKTTVDHAMQLVGYGKTDSGDLYWICKNSWGSGWGEKGYIRVLRGQNTCGIATYVAQVA